MTMMIPSLALMAHAYLKRRYSVFPLYPQSKQPLVPWKPFQTARPSPKLVSRWWTRWPFAGIGLVTGAVSGLLVLDFDTTDAEAALTARYGPLPIAPRTRTAKGCHVYLAHPGGGQLIKSRARLFPGIDVRGDRGFVVAPPSVHQSGHVYDFELDTVTLPPCPDWLLVELAKPAVIEGGTGSTRRAFPAGRVVEGTRNDRLFRLGCAMRADGADEGLIRVALEVENEDQCDPPLSDSEVADIAASVARRYPPGRVRTHRPTAVPIRGGSDVAEPDIDRVRRVIEKHFPGLWRPVEAGLSVYASLFLEDNANPVALIYVGPPSSSKTTVADMFTGHSLTYRSDNFTAASFVSQAANVKADALAKVDLLPKIQHKILVTPELAPLFRGKEDDLASRLAILTRVLDGQGLTTDSGTHGQRGYTGDYLFGWLGCSTPFGDQAWRVMAQLGSRLYFWDMASAATVDEDSLVASVSGVPYRTKLQECRREVHRMVDSLVSRYGGPRKMVWNGADDPEDVVRWIVRCATLVATSRSEPEREADGEFRPTKPEVPYRALQVLRNLARGRALVHGRQRLAPDDLGLVAHVALSSVPPRVRGVLLALIEGGGDPVTVEEVRARMGVRSSQTARDAMKALAARGIADYVEAGNGRPAILRLRPEWEWCASPEFRAWLEGSNLSANGGCVDPSNLVQRQ